MSDEDEWFGLRLAFLRERVVHNGAASDYVALVRQLMEGQKTYGNAEYLTEAAAELEQARTKYPNSVAVWEHSALFDSQYGTEQDFNRSLGVLSRLDPDSSIIRALDRMTPADIEQWNQQAMETSRQLLENAGSADPAVSAAAIAGLQDWARSYPQNSTHVINLSLGLVSAGRADEARSLALSAAEIEDGSFEDAYNIGIVLAAVGDPEGARPFLTEALARAPSQDHQALTREALGRLPAGSL
jgi:tetratricopeptide (TPR) repeat protein